MEDCAPIFFWGGIFSNFGYRSESRESPILELGISRIDFEESIEGLSFCVFEDDLVTTMSKHCLLTEKLTKYYSLVYWEGEVPGALGIFFLRNVYGECKLGR